MNDDAVDEIIQRSTAYWQERRAHDARVAAYEAHPDRLIEDKIRNMFKAGMSHVDVVKAMRCPVN